MRRVALWLLLGPIYLWRFVVHALVPGGPATCRFEPSCSRYAEQAIRIHGPLRGSLMAIRRLSHCHPFSRHDPIDPVTPR
ncbi:MAG: membrane protein insertion efficiency factor YidD [Actinomycetota bacterium]|jgi:putative membrane protein insertion efficiency factor|nr:membrane protein insertion efficiency factor YidD [Actinomycetota bacterium]